MTDDRDGPGGHAPRMRTLRSAVLLLLLVTGCAPEAALPAPPAEQPAASTDAPAATPKTRSQCAQWHRGKAYADYLRRWRYGPEGVRTFEAGGLEIERILAKPWGRLAMVEARMTLVAHIPGANDETRTQRVRIVP